MAYADEVDELVEKIIDRAVEFSMSAHGWQLNCPGQLRAGDGQRRRSDHAAGQAGTYVGWPGHRVRCSLRRRLRVRVRRRRGHARLPPLQEHHPRHVPAVAEPPGPRVADRKPLRTRRNAGMKRIIISSLVVLFGIVAIAGGFSKLGDSTVRCGGRLMQAGDECVSTSTTGSETGRKSVDEQRSSDKAATRGAAALRNWTGPVNTPTSQLVICCSALSVVVLP